MIIRTKGISSSGNMNEGFFRPVCLINVVGVFFHLSVQSYQSLIVSSFYAAFISGVAAEVKHVPDVGSPKIRSLIDDFCHMFMVLGLIFLCIVLAFWIVCMPADNALAAIFGNTQRPVRIHLMEFIQPFFILGIVPAVPAKIMVIAEHICDLVVSGLFRKGRYLCHSSQSGGIQLLHQFVQIFQIFLKSRTVSADGNLIRDAPEADAGMIIVLIDQFLHLLAAVVMSFGIFAHNRDKRNLCPYYQAQCVAGIIECLIMLIVGQPDCICPQLCDQVGIL